MAANGEGPPPPPPPFIKKEEGGVSDDVDQNDHNDHHGHVRSINNNMKVVSIADRRAAKCGFNADNINVARFGTGCNNNASMSPHVRSPYVTIPPGISPSALLDSPMLVPNAQAQLSPTTGTFHQFPSSPNPESLKLKLKLANEEEDDDTIKAFDSSSNPEPHSVENLLFEEYYKYPRDLHEPSKEDCFDDTLATTELCSSLHQTSNNTCDKMSREVRNTDVNINPNYQKNKHNDHSEDGFCWRKYGQKHVKGSDFPRSYYKCTNVDCLVKKKVERSHEGVITQIVYKGSHNHPVPQPSNKRLNDISLEMANNDQGGCAGTSFKAECTNDVVFGSDRNWIPGHGGLDAANASASLLGEFPHNNNNNNSLLSVSNFDRAHVDTTNQDFSTIIVGSQDGEDQNQASPESISYKDEDDENNVECEHKKRKRENFPSNETNIPRSGRESKVVVQIESDVDILDDGYRWRKYGQKVVKGNPNPRSYYKCTTAGCPVRKHVERAANDIKSVLTTYEGKHNHDVPTSKTGSLAISDAANQLQQAVANNNIGGSSSSQLKPSKAGKQAQDNSLPLYMERKPNLSYNDFLRSNLAGNFPGPHHHDLGFGAPSPLYPYSYPPFPSLAYNSPLMNGNSNNNNNNHIKAYSSLSKFNYPMLAPDYMSMQSSQMNHHHVPMGRVATQVPNMGGNFAFNNYVVLQNSNQGQHEQIGECQTRNMMKPKEEQMEDEGELFDTRFSVPNHGNGNV
ncbi:hypothetical protein CASFOL_023894 [Castilleja foliolosa]|uniref:WRKY domain-containing protein n=1 Tax=Castilleja foliolosa TaxID=1961234 RepID=A0ABD3CQB0_9LAMI